MNIVFFDGVCGLCNSLVQFLLKIDKNKKLYFSPLQGLEAQKKNLFIKGTSPSTFIYWKNGVVFEKSTAVLKLSLDLGGVYKLALLFFIVPRFMRDFLYDFVAKNRYSWFGKTVTCRIPTSEEKTQFLE